MKRSKFLLVALIATLFVGFSSCSDDDINDIKVEKNEVNIEKGEKAVVKITAGNGEYTATSAKEETATASAKDNEVTITGVETGSTIVTVKDKEGKTATITVNVVSIVGTWNLEKLSAEVEAKDEATIAEIKESLVDNGLKSITFNEDGTFSLKGEDEDSEYSGTGTYVYADKVITFTEDAENEEEADTWSVKVTEITKTSLKYAQDETEDYKGEYPEGEVTKAIALFELTINQ